MNPLIFSKEKGKHFILLIIFLTFTDALYFPFSVSHGLFNMPYHIVSSHPKFQPPKHILLFKSLGVWTWISFIIAFSIIALSLGIRNVIMRETKNFGNFIF